MATPGTSHAPLLPPAFFFSVFLDMLVIALVVPLMSLLIEELGVPAGQLGYYQAIYGFMQIVSTPILGTLSDRIGRRPVLTASVAGTAVAFAFLSVSLVMKSVTLFVVSRVLVGGLRQTMSIGAALIGERAALRANAECAPDAEHREIEARRERETARGLATFQSSASFGFVVGPLMGGLLADGYGLVATTALAAGINAANSLLMFAVTAPPPATAAATAAAAEKHRQASPTPPSPSTPRANPVAVAYSVVSRGGPMSALLVGMYFFSLSYVLIQTMVSGYLRGFFKAVMLPRLLQRFRPRTIVTCAMWTACAGYAFQALAPTIQAFAVGTVVTSLSSGVADTLNKSRFSSHYASDRGGEIMAIVYSIDGANRVIAPLLGSYLINVAPSAPAVFIAAACATCSVACVLVTLASFRGDGGAKAKTA